MTWRGAAGLGRGDRGPGGLHHNRRQRLPRSGENLARLWSCRHRPGRNSAGTDGRGGGGWRRRLHCRTGSRQWRAKPLWRGAAGQQSFLQGGCLGRDRRTRRLGRHRAGRRGWGPESHRGSAQSGCLQSALDGFRRRSRRRFSDPANLRGAFSFLRKETEMAPQPVGHVVVDRTGVRPLFGDAELGQHLNKPVRLHLEFPRQLVDSDLTHKTC